MKNNIRKLEKARAKRKDYEKRRNIFRNLKDNNKARAVIKGGILPKSKKWKPKKK